MPPPSLWSGNLRLSLVLIPVKLCPAISNEEAVSFRMIHEPSRKPIRYVKGVHEGDKFIEVPEEEIIKGYEHAKGHHVLIDPKELDELKLEAKHTIDMVRFVDEAEIDSRYWEKPYYLVPDGDDADEGYTVIRDALKQTRKVAIGQLIMHGRGHLVGIKALRTRPYAFDLALRERSPRRRALLRQTHNEAEHRVSHLSERVDQANEWAL